MEEKTINKLTFKERIQDFVFIGKKKRKQKLLVKYGDFLEDSIERIENEKKLGKYLKLGLGSDFQKIRGAWNQYKNEEIDKTVFISLCVIILGTKFIDLFVRESKDILLTRKTSVYLTFIIVFIGVFAFCMFYFLLLMNVDIIANPDGNFIIPGNEQSEWIFTIWMAVIMIMSCGFLASLLLPRVTVKAYTKSIKKDQRFGLVETEILFGGALTRKILLRAMILGFLVYNFSYTLASQRVFVEYMRSVNPAGVGMIPDPELMIQMLWIVSIPCVFVIIPIWLMNDIGIAKTEKVKGTEFESLNLTGSKFYKFIKGYASIGFIYNLVFIIGVWAVEDIPLMRVIMRIASPIIVISFMFPLVVFIEARNEHFKKKLWTKLQKFDINKKLSVEIKVETITSYDEILKY